MPKNKKLLIFGLALIILILAGIIIWKRSDSANKLQPTLVEAGPEFMTDSEKTKLGIPAELKIQTLRRDEIGEVTVYKIIRDESDIVLDQTKIGPINPDQPAQ